MWCSDFNPVLKLDDFSLSKKPVTCHLVFNIVYLIYVKVSLGCQFQIYLEKA